jgi:2-polyprenyl-6-methoxyphenol hydroxylase-like FAD-dependent oxidoreductase
LFLAPTDNATWFLCVWALPEDDAVRPLRDIERFNEVVRRFPDREEWMQGEPISDVMPCVSAGDLTRRFVIEGKPIVTGVVAVGDAHAFTEPRMGRGTLTAVKQAVALRNTLREHLADGPAAIAVAWEDAFQRELGPLLRATSSVGRTFAKDTRSCISGDGPVFDPSDRRIVLNRAYVNAARVDAQAGRWLLDVAGAEILLAELFAQPGVLDRILELGNHDGADERFGPTRTELLEILSR